MDVTLTINTRDFSGRLSKYSVKHEPIVRKVVTTMDYVEHVAIERYRTIIRFALIPISDDDAEYDYAALSEGVFSATYTDPYAGADVSQMMRLNTNLSAAYGIKSADGNHYYKGGEIELRAIAPGLGEEQEEY